ncbi:MAG TPA: ACT domain-containing protein [Armatimonadota bacterium]|jgi:hypothetical protein
MSVQQLAVFLENKAGRLADVTKVLGDAGVNVRGFSVADSSEYGILRLIVDDTNKALSALKARSFTVHCSDVLCVRVPDRPGALSSALSVLGDKGINIEYMYPIAIAVIVFGVERLEYAIESLQSTDTVVLTAEDIAGL